MDKVKNMTSSRALLRTIVAAAVLLVGLAVSEATCAAEPSAETNARPNIVWIFVEDMNGWYGCYGDETVPTPNIDALAKRGVKFNRAYMPAGVCSATRSAIALGAMQTSMGVHQHRSSRRRVPEEVIRLPEGVKTVYEVMRQSGYYVISSPGKNDFNFIFEMDDLYDDQGQYPESIDSLRGVLKQWQDKCVNPEYDAVRAAENPQEVSTTQ